MPDLGNKHECPSCGAKFYDLGRPEPVCPRCEVNIAEIEEGNDNAAAPAANKPADAPAGKKKAAKAVKEKKKG